MGKRDYRSGTILRPKTPNLKLVLGSICLGRMISILELPRISTFEHRPLIFTTERHVYDELGIALLRKIDAAASGRFSKRDGKKHPRMPATTADLLQHRSSKQHQCGKFAT